MDENRNSKVHTIKMLLDSDASESIVRKDVLYKRHKTFKDKKNKWSTVTWTFKTTFVTELRIKSFYRNLRKMIFDRLIIKLRFNTR